MPTESPILVTDNTAASPQALLAHFQTVRRATEKLCEPLEVEDYVIQSMPDTSPVKWHLAHTTWFFETFVLGNRQPFHPDFGFLFNSYYHAVGPRWPRPQRGVLSRPTVAEVYRYRAHVDEQIVELLQALDTDWELMAAVMTLGINHEQQHQELILTDLKHAWATNPLHPVYRPALGNKGDPPTSRWLGFSGGKVCIGHSGRDFAFDNETPRHEVLLQGFELANRLVTSADYLSFTADDGYDRPELWLSDGWAAREAQRWTAPLYWQKRNGEWLQVTLAGLRAIDPEEPVCHISYYEADAYARWRDARLPTEAEWEWAAAQQSQAGHFLEAGRFHPAASPAATDSGPLYQAHGDVWQWTASPYPGYPGYRPLPGALGEYNGKFMCNQLVLRGSSCATPGSHARLTYRNFFPPDARWQFNGLRLARDLP